jgi:hypothetical protein
MRLSGVYLKNLLRLKHLYNCEPKDVRIAQSVSHLDTLTEKIVVLQMMAWLTM